ncbi:MAG: hypothetical protein AAFP79_15985 [Pseudomonadota bacterium]
MAADSATELNAAKHCALLNSRYHADREAYLDRLDRNITFGILATGAAAFTQFFGSEVQAIGAAVLTVFALARIVFETGKKARLHSDLRRQYLEISAKLEEGKLLARSANGQMMRLAAKEPPVFCAVHALAENWATRAVYGEGQSLPCEIGVWSRLTRNILRHESRNFGCD